MSEEIQSSPFPSSGRKRKARPSGDSYAVIPTQTVRRIYRFPARKVRNPYKDVHYFKRTSALFGPLTTDSINPIREAFNFSFSDVPGYTELTALFDYYKITGIKVRIMPFSQDTSISTASLNNSYNPPIYTATDTTDGSSPSSVDAVLEYDTLKIGWLWKGISCYFKPKYADATSAQRGGWVATSNSSLDWYGLKVAIPPTGGSAAKATMLVTFYVQCKNVK